MVSGGGKHRDPSWRGLPRQESGGASRGRRRAERKQTLPQWQVGKCRGGGTQGLPRLPQRRSKGVSPGAPRKPRPGKSTRPLSTTSPAERLDPGVQDTQGAEQVSWGALGEREPVGGDHVGRPHGRPFILIFSYVFPSLIKCIITYLV